MGGFSVVDYVVFASSLVASFVIGIYTAFSGKKEKTTEDFYFGNRDMNIVAVAMSLASTFLSGVGLLGNLNFELKLETMSLCVHVYD